VVSQQMWLLVAGLTIHLSCFLNPFMLVMLPNMKTENDEAVKSNSKGSRMIFAA
jgi:hypothetical protein